MISVLRVQLDQLDQQIIDLLLQRRYVSGQIGEWKLDQQIEPLQTNEQQNRERMWTDELGEYGRRVYQVIHDESVKIQNEIY